MTARLRSLFRPVGLLTWLIVAATVELATAGLISGAVQQNLDRAYVVFFVGVMSGLATVGVLGTAPVEWAARQGLLTKLLVGLSAALFLFGSLAITPFVTPALLLVALGFLAVVRYFSILGRHGR